MRCPVCKAENAQGPTCRRCKADLSLLFAIEGQHAEALARARLALGQGRGPEAYESARRACGLKADEESLRALALAALLVEDHVTAWRCWQRLRGAGGPAG